MTAKFSTALQKQRELIDLYLGEESRYYKFYFVYSIYRTIPLDEKKWESKGFTQNFDQQKELDQISLSMKTMFQDLYILIYIIIRTSNEKK